MRLLDHASEHGAGESQIANQKSKMQFMDGVLIIDKPAGLTFVRCRRAYAAHPGRTARGNTGTLDPFATGVQVVLVGRATRKRRHFCEEQAPT